MLEFQYESLQLIVMDHYTMFSATDIVQIIASSTSIILTTILPNVWIQLQFVKV